MKYKLLLITLFACGLGWGQTTIAGWDFFGQSSPATFAATTFNSNLVTTSNLNLITRGSAAATSSGSNSFRTQGFKNQTISTSSNAYFQITLKPTAGYKLSLSSIDARFAGTSSFYASPGVTSQFAYSLDGVNFTFIGSPTQSTSLTLTQIDLSGISQLQNVNSGITITIRYYASGQTTTGGWGFASTSSGNNGLAIGGSVESLGSNTISTGTLTGAPFCVDGTNGAAGTIAYTSTGTYNGTFTAQLSDANGSFDSPVAIGTGTSPIAVNIPAGTALGSGYRVRVVNDDPATVGSSSTAFSVINTPPTLTTPTSTSITVSSAVLGGNVTVVGCTSVTTRGIEFSTTPGFSNGSGTIVSESGTFSTGTFTVNVSGLTSGTTYYYKAFATSASGTSYTTEASFSTLAIAAPQSNAASGVGATSFTATWDAVPGATGYEIDVYKINLTSNTTTETFTSIGGGTSTGYFTRAWTGTDNISWTAYKSRIDQVIFSGNDALTLRDESGSYLESGEITGNPTNISFDLKQSFTGSGGEITLSILHGASFGTTTQIGVYPYTTSTQNIVAPISGITGPFKVVLSNNAAARPTIDNLAITKLTESISYILQNQNVGNVTSYPITGLDQNTTYYYVVRAIDATSESVNSNEITTTTTIVSTTWNGTAWSNSAPTASVDAIIDGDLPTTTDLTCEDLTINSGKTLTIGAGKKLTVSGNLINNGTIVFKSTATSTAMFDTFSGTLSGSGVTTVERFIPARRAYRFLSPSVTTSTTIRQNWQENGGTAAGLGTHITGIDGATNGFDPTETNNPSLLLFTNGAWVGATSTNVGLTAGNAYCLMVRGDRTTDLTTNTPTPTNTVLRATGTLFTGDFSPVLSAAASGYSFVGNPYQAPLDIKTALQSSTDVNKNVVYYWDPTINARGGYITRNLQTSQNIPTSSVNDYVQPGQAFFVVNEPTLTSTPALTFTENHKSVANAAAGVFRNANANEYGTLRVNLQANTNNQWQTIEGALAIFNDNFSWNVTSEDATKIANLDEEVSFIQNNTSLAIACQSNPSRTSELPLKIERMRHSTYQWQFDLNNYEGERAYLFDALNNTYTAITNGSVVPFTADANTTNRFKIVFQTSALSTADFANNIKLYPNPAKAGGSFYVDGITEATVSVYNVVGQNIPVTVMSQGNAVQVTPSASLSKGVYLVSITTQGITKQVKWIVE